MKNAENNPPEADRFVQRLQRQPLREIPRAWRAEILREGRRAAVPNQKWDANMASLPSLLRWGALAAVWMVIIALNHASRDASPVVEAKYAPPSPQMIQVLREQRKLLAELADPSGALPQPEQPKPAQPGPQSQRREETAAV
jgi:hypothetical protein